MLISVTLGGHRSPWDFSESVRFWSWMSSKPWNSLGGSAVIRCGGTGASLALNSWLMSTIFAAAAGENRLTIVSLNSTKLDHGFCTALASSLFLPETSRPRELATRLETALKGKQLIVHGHLCSGGNSQIFSELNELLDLLSKLSHPIALTVILFTDRRTVDGASSVFDFRAGCPSEPAITYLGSPDSARWPAYLHHRIAWESAGNLAHALEISNTPEIMSLITKVGEDNALEKAFGNFADLSFSKLENSEQSAWKSYAFAHAASFPNSAFGLWRPTGSDTPRPVPWLARVLLRMGSRGSARLRLRNCLVCRPLAVDLLARCLELEARLHAAHANELIAATPRAGSKAQDTHHHFKAGHYPLLAYPQGHPAPPTLSEDVWLFESLGGIVEQLAPTLNRHLASRYRELVGLRNAVAHGHYVGWPQWETLRQLSGLTL